MKTFATKQRKSSQRRHTFNRPIDIVEDFVVADSLHLFDLGIH